ncbi:unnamed protein product [Moneuplotes crassus]|uniref:Uncharacterized protein n=1 Tax=Euplotes crassus TaxID=5936 RepID=A0AAD1Y069_EUPCR|nr:unnamed protein product [Moneuplotes crassus]
MKVFWIILDLRYAFFSFRGVNLVLCQSSISYFELIYTLTWQTLVTYQDYSRRTLGDFSFQIYIQEQLYFMCKGSSSLQSPYIRLIFAKNISQNFSKSKIM